MEEIMVHEQTTQVQPNDCPMCANKPLADRWSRAIVLGQRSSVDAANLFKMTIAQVEDHVYKHTTALEKTDPVQDKDYFLKALNTINKNLEEVLSDLMMNKEIDVRKLTSLTKEVRETLKLLAEVAGVIGADNSAAMQKQLVDMNTKYAVLVGIVLEEACPECQQRIVAKIKGATDGNSKKIES